jgi:hypothetical protein
LPKAVAYARPVAWWAFTETREVQFDEKWSFVGKKEKHCDPANPNDAKQGDNWDHVALDAEHRLVVSVVPGKRTVENVEALVQDFHERTEGRPKAPYYKPSSDLRYATVHKTREKGRVVRTLRQQGSDGRWLPASPIMCGPFGNG